MATVTGIVRKAYSPSAKTGYSKFFFEVEQAGGVCQKGMAPASEEMLKAIVLGATVEVEGRLYGGWLNPKSVRVLQAAVVPETVMTISIGHVGQAKPTKYGLGFYAHLEGGVSGAEWAVIPVDVAAEYFKLDPNEDWGFPRRGRGTLRGTVKVNGGVTVTKIEQWIPLTQAIDILVPFGDIVWGFNLAFEVNGQTVSIRRDSLPVDFDPTIDYADMPGALRVRGQAVAYSRSFNQVGWELENVEVTIDADMAEKIGFLVNTLKVQRAVSIVQAKVLELTSNGVVVDEGLIAELFLNQGVTDSEKVREVFLGTYDARYLDALKDMASEVWKTADGFILHSGEWLIWERCIQGAATYMVPDRPNLEFVNGEDLTVAEWAGVLGQVLPWAPKMDLRYGELGQAIAGTEEGVRFAIHTENDAGEFPGWLDAVQATVELETTPLGTMAGLPSLADVLALVASNEE